MVKDNERSENHVKQLQLNDRRLTIKKTLLFLCNNMNFLCTAGVYVLAQLLLITNLFDLSKKITKNKPLGLNHSYKNKLKLYRKLWFGISRLVFGMFK